MSGILVVDDQKDCADSLRLVLQSQGYTVTVAYDGEECLAHMQNALPDVVFLDVLMPGMGGVEVAHEIQKKYGNAVKIVLVSILPQAETNDIVVDAYVQKPYHVEDVLHVAKQLLA